VWRRIEGFEEAMDQMYVVFSYSALSIDEGWLGMFLALTNIMDNPKLYGFD